MPPHGVETLTHQAEFRFLIVYGQTTVLAPVIILDEVLEDIHKNFGKDAEVVELRRVSH
jgi:hypothetical protein